MLWLRERLEAEAAAAAAAADAREYLQVTDTAHEVVCHVPCINVSGCYECHALMQSRACCNGCVRARGAADWGEGEQRRTFRMPRRRALMWRRSTSYKDSLPERGGRQAPAVDIAFAAICRAVVLLWKWAASSDRRTSQHPSIAPRPAPAHTSGLPRLAVSCQKPAMLAFRQLMFAVPRHCVAEDPTSIQ